VTGFGDHQQNDIPICKAGAYCCNTSRGPTILIAPQSAFRGIGKSILSSIQMEAYGNSVDEKSVRAGGKQCITTLEGYVLPIDIIEGLSYLRTRAYTDKEYDELPHVLLSSDSDWDPTIFDNNMMGPPFNEYGKHRHTTDDPEVEVDLRLLNYHTEIKEHFFDNTDIGKMSPEDVVDYAAMTPVQAAREYDESIADYTRAYGESIDKPKRDGSRIFINEHSVKIQPVPNAAPLEASIRPFLLYANAEVVKKTLRVKHDSGENVPPSQFVKSKSDEEAGNTTEKGLIVVDPSDLIGRTFLQNVNNEDETGHRYYKFVEAIQTRNAKLKKDLTSLKFICSVNDDEYQEILSYTEILDSINSQAQNEEQIWRFKRIFAHHGPLRPTDTDWKGSAYNVGLEWENGERTYEPFAISAADDPVTCAIYARDKELLQTDECRRFKRIVKDQKKLSRMLNQANLRSYSRGPKYMYGLQVPHDHAEAVRLDEKNGNTLYQDAEAVEIQQLKEYDTFHDKGVYSKDRYTTLQGYKMIRLRMIYAAKHDGRRKARILNSVYSEAISLRGLRLIISAKVWQLLRPLLFWARTDKAKSDDKPP
jgi:hypothetical protein